MPLAKRFHGIQGPGEECEQPPVGRRAPGPPTESSPEAAEHLEAPGREHQDAKGHRHHQVAAGVQRDPVSADPQVVAELAEHQRHHELNQALRIARQEPHRKADERQQRRPLEARVEREQLLPPGRPHGDARISRGLQVEGVRQGIAKDDEPKDQDRREGDGTDRARGERFAPSPVSMNDRPEPDRREDDPARPPPPRTAWRRKRGDTWESRANGIAT